MAQTKEERVQKGIAYRKAHVRQIKLDLSIEYDSDILAHLDSLPNRTGYLKDLIRADIARANSEQKEEGQTMKQWYIIKATCAKSGEGCDRDGLKREILCAIDGPEDPSWIQLEEMLSSAKINISAEYREHDPLRDVYRIKDSSGVIYEIADYKG